MKFRTAVLLGGVVLMAAIPVCADTVFYTASIKESSFPENSAPTINVSHTKLLLPVTAGRESYGNEARNLAFEITQLQSDARPAHPTLAMLSTNDIQSGGVFAASGSEMFFILDPLVPTASEPSIRFGSPAELDAGAPASSTLGAEGFQLGVFGRDPDRGRGGEGKNKNQSDPSVAVSEPGVLPLLMLGLLAVGISGLRPRDFPTCASSRADL
ncbi:MAG TPA: hypothetical protein VIH75_03085 [Candidatus Sulfotelmatobacter sp.]|jgi:hypothetical protein